MDEKSLNEFLEKFYDNRHTEQEHQLFIDWLKSAPDHQVEEILEKYLLIFESRQDNTSKDYTTLVQQIEARLDTVNEKEFKTASSVKLWSVYKKVASIAAVFLVGTAFAIFFTLKVNPTQNVNDNKVVNLKKPDTLTFGNKALLTLANGSRIILDSAENGLLAVESGMSFNKTAEGHIVCSKSFFSQFKSAYNTIETSRGGQYQITLSDGTKVWLNAASVLKFPASFSDNERIVELHGEAYFEVAKNHSAEGVSTRFKVVSGSHTVDVLGTHFNVKSYPEETAVTTTLLEGSVKITQNGINKSEILKPGQQSKAGDIIKVIDVDPIQSIAWKNGYFDFSNENIENIMRSISRWYDVDVNYEKGVTKEKFIGSISRYKEVSDVLKMLELTGSVRFKLEGRRITVRP